MAPVAARAPGSERMMHAFPAPSARLALQAHGRAHASPGAVTRAVANAAGRLARAPAAAAPLRAQPASDAACGRPAAGPRPPPPTDLTGVRPWELAVAAQWVAVGQYLDSTSTDRTRHDFMNAEFKDIKGPGPGGPGVGGGGDCARKDRPEFKDIKGASNSQGGLVLEVQMSRYKNRLRKGCWVEVGLPDGRRMEASCTMAEGKVGQLGQLHWIIDGTAREEKVQPSEVADVHTVSSIEVLEEGGNRSGTQTVNQLLSKVLSSTASLQGYPLVHGIFGGGSLAACAVQRALAARCRVQVERRPDALQGVLTGYDLQRSRLDQQITQMYGDSSSSDRVYNIDSFQGREDEVVIVSLVRVKALGFMADDRRVNVMLTRCTRQLVIVGSLKMALRNPSTLIGRIAAYCHTHRMVEAPPPLDAWSRGRSQGSGPMTASDHSSLPSGRGAASPSSGPNASTTRCASAPGGSCARAQAHSSAASTSASAGSSPHDSAASRSASNSRGTARPAAEKPNAMFARSATPQSGAASVPGPVAPAPPEPALPHSRQPITTSSRARWKPCTCRIDFLFSAEPSPSSTCVATILRLGGGAPPPSLSAPATATALG
ncbi:hypothetical protein TSOC_008458 [Tetrabaena socialis]|uniref:DNA2/NAM7 helicase-like C-terminal domain-containing protein n=1 Tax=Tetrabaena socialis TaxID=47790 RepID=A0A2J7ZYC6_9CHLO|nr:hypothetical protein TSOC_008458 [Tetrabaena socialis]|eukprot:PNH05271.1 hypothetical protein TSOC_008458 [Tetrabaena socialis]